MSQRFKKHFNEKGAIDLASVMTGLIVLGLIGGIIATTVFIVIPWAQDEAAKRQVNDIKVAQTTYAAGNSDPNNPLYSALVQAAETPPVEFAPLSTLVEHGLLTVELDETAVNGIITTANKGRICANTTPTGGYEIAVRSQTGNVFYTTDLEQGVKKAADGNLYCLRDSVATEDTPAVFKFTIDTSLCSNPTMYFGEISPGAKLIHDESGTVTELKEGANTLNGNHSWTVEGTFNILGGMNNLDNGCLLSVDEWSSPTSYPTDQEYVNAMRKWVVDTETYENSITYEMLLQVQASPEYAELVRAFTAGEIDMVQAAEEQDRIVALFAGPAPTRPSTADGYIDISYAFSNATNLTSVVAPPYHVINMAGIFYEANVFNGSLNDWDTSQVVDMRSAFNKASSFNQPLNNWDTGNVVHMGWMFSPAASFNGDISNWDTSNVKSFTFMFSGAASFNGDISNWDISQATDISFMLYNTASFNQPLNSWDTSNVTNMQAVFASAISFNQPLDNWDTGQVTQTLGMFNGAPSFNQSLNSWDMSKVTTTSGMFASALSFNQPLDNWDMSNVTDMKMMFRDARAFDQDISNWDTSQVTDMTWMFNGAKSFTGNISNWDVSNVTIWDRFSYDSALTTVNTPAKFRP